MDIAEIQRIQSENRSAELPELKLEGPAFLLAVGAATILVIYLLRKRGGHG